MAVRFKRRMLPGLIFGLALTGLCGCDLLPLGKPGPHPETEIFQGVFYEAVELPETDESGGIAHIVRVDLTAPGIELYITPLDSNAVREGYQYRLRHAARVARDEDLAVVVNGTHFGSEGRWFFPNAFARAVETVVARGEISHVNRHSYMLWFEEDLTSHLAPRRPPPEDVLERAYWGIGSQRPILRGGEVQSETDPEAVQRTMLAVDSERMLLWLAVFEHASFSTAAKTLAEKGARDGVILDGGGSTTMYIARRARGGRTGTLLGGWRPVANHVGIRARPLK